jgi:hypothetical protein
MKKIKKTYVRGIDFSVKTANGVVSHLIRMVFAEPYSVLCDAKLQQEQIGARNIIRQSFIVHNSLRK